MCASSSPATRRLIRSGSAWEGIVIAHEGAYTSDPITVRPPPPSLPNKAITILSRCPSMRAWMRNTPCFVPQRSIFLISYRVYNEITQRRALWHKTDFHAREHLAVHFCSLYKPTCHRASHPYARGLHVSVALTNNRGNVTCLLIYIAELPLHCVPDWWQQRLMPVVLLQQGITSSFTKPNSHVLLT